MKDVVIYGYYGQKNTGDDYIMLSVINSVLKSKIDNIFVIVKDNCFTEFSFPNKVHFITLNKNVFLRQLQIAFYACKCKKFIIGGGGLWPNDSTGKVFTNYLWITLARLFGTHIVMYGIEVTKIRKKKTANLWRRMLKKLDWIITRTKASLNTLADTEKLGTTEKIFYSPDITYALKDEDLKRYFLETKDIKRDKKIENNIIIWALAMPWSVEERADTHFQERYKTLLHDLIDVHHQVDILYPDCKNILVPFLKPNDMTIAEDLISAGFDNAEIFQGDWTEIRPLFGQARFAIDMRFHSVIFSMFECCPFAALSYSPKTTDTLRDNGLSCFTEFGIRESAYFYKEFDLNKYELLKVINKTVNYNQQVNTHFHQVTKKRAKDNTNDLVSMATKSESKLIAWLNQ